LIRSHLYPVQSGRGRREFDWAYDFIHSHRELLAEGKRHGTFSFNLARYYSDKRDYDRAMPLLQQMDFDDPLLNLQGKMMLLKMYYETDAQNALESLLTSLDAYLRRKKLGEQQREAHRNALRFVRRLFLLPERDTAGRAALRKEIGDTDLVAMKEWLMEVTGK